MTRDATENTYFLLHLKCSLGLLDQMHCILVAGSAYQAHLLI